MTSSTLLDCVELDLKRGENTLQIGLALDNPDQHWADDWWPHVGGSSTAAINNCHNVRIAVQPARTEDR